MHAAAYKALPRLWFGFPSLEAGLLWFCKWGSRGSPGSELWSSCFLTTQSAWKHWWFRWTGGREKILAEIFVILNLVQKAYCCVFLISIYSEVGLVLLKANLFSGHFVKNYIFHESFQLFFFSFPACQVDMAGYENRSVYSLKFFKVFHGWLGTPGPYHGILAERNGIWILQV